MSVKVIKAGIFDSIQDMGRWGYQSMGINPTGAMDKYAMQIANMLVGNKPDEAVIEMHFPASVFMFTQASIIAIAGANFSASINGEPVPNLHCIAVERNDVLQFHQPEKGARAYLAVKGGFALHKWMNSYSTHLKVKAGGYQGRVLQKDDELLFQSSIDVSTIVKEKEFLVLPWQVDMNDGALANEEANIFYVLRGNEWDRLSEEAKSKFFNTSYVVGHQSDRMAYRLQHIPLQSNSVEEVISAAVNFGTIQLLPDGQLLILMADHQTTGGYPRVAHIISAHHSRLAQVKTGEAIRFQLTDQQTAETLLMNRQQHLQQLQSACSFRLQEYLNK
jgi:antagonist of KipI